MKKLEKFVNEIDDNQLTGQSQIMEGRPKGSTNKKKDDEPDAEDVIGLDSEENETGGVYGISEPVDDAAIEAIDLDSDENTESMEDLIDKFDAEEDFFIIGRAGWGKTSIIEGLATKYKRTVVTVYLDKAEAEDLGCTPFVGKNKMGKAVQKTAMPEWASYMMEHPKENFLLFFDEMNQAAPDVMNALMPIVLKHTICGVKFKNFFVGAAGNFKEENGVVEELSKPLESRFKPIITWETHTPRSWKQAFDFLHKKWDEKLGKEFVDKYEELHDAFDNPREIDDKIFKFIYAIANKKDAHGRAKTTKIHRRLLNLAADDLDRHLETGLEKLAEYTHDYIVNGGKAPESKSRASRKDIEMTPANLRESIKNAMRFGFMEQKEDGKVVKYGISRENINVILELCEDDSLNKEIFQRLLNKFEADGIKFKFEKDSEWKKAGYKDPYAD